MKRAVLMTVAAVPLLIASAMASAANLPGSFPGVTIDAKLIGGQEYETLYPRIAEWEKLTGAKVNIISKKNHFELDKEFKSDIAAGSIHWCVGSNHTSFAPQYPNLYTDLSKLIPKDEIDKRYLNHPYYIVPDGKAGIDAFAVIRDAMQNQDRVALARIGPASPIVA